MTEAEWLACTDPGALFTHLGPKLNERRLTLFACACCRRVWGLLTDERSRRSVEYAEREADGAAEDEPFHSMISRAYSACEAARSRNDDPGYEVAAAAHDAAVVRFHGPHLAANLAGRIASSTADAAAERAAQANLVRDIFGNPFRPGALDPFWLAWGNGFIARLSREIYDERAFERLPILADALEDAGCREEVLLGHCRSGAEHARGCWALDLLLTRP
jgi:hypothetical protein